jgi:hypothetical protein
MIKIMYTHCQSVSWMNMPERNRWTHFFENYQFWCGAVDPTLDIIRTVVSANDSLGCTYKDR